MSDVVYFVIKGPNGLYWSGGGWSSRGGAYMFDTYKQAANVLAGTNWLSDVHRIVKVTKRKKKRPTVEELVTRNSTGDDIFIGGKFITCDVHPNLALTYNRIVEALRPWFPGR